MPRRELDGARIDGVILEYEVPRKALCDESGIDESSFCKFVNAQQEIQPYKVFQLGRAFERLLAKQGIEKGAA